MTGSRTGAASPERHRTRRRHRRVEAPSPFVIMRQLSPAPKASPPGGYAGLDPDSELARGRRQAERAENSRSASPTPSRHPLTRGAPSWMTRYFSVGLAGLEPATSALSVLRSNRLSYSPGRLAKLHPSTGGRAGWRTGGRTGRARPAGSDFLPRLGEHRRDCRHRLAGVEIHHPHSRRVPPLGGDLANRHPDHDT